MPSCDLCKKFHHGGDSTKLVVRCHSCVRKAYIYQLQLKTQFEVKMKAEIRILMEEYYANGGVPRLVGVELNPGPDHIDLFWFSMMVIGFFAGMLLAKITLPAVHPPNPPLVGIEPNPGPDHIDLTIEDEPNSPAFEFSHWDPAWNEPIQWLNAEEVESIVKAAEPIIGTIESQIEEGLITHMHTDVLEKELLQEYTVKEMVEMLEDFAEAFRFKM